MHVTARADYAIRAVLELAVRAPKSATRRDIAKSQDIPGKFLEAILADLRRAGIVESLRGQSGGYKIARAPESISLAEIIRAIEGPLAAVRGRPPEDTEYPDAALGLTEVWVAVRASLREVLETTTVAHVVARDLPPYVRELLDRPESWVRR